MPTYIYRDFPIYIGPLNEQGEYEVSMSGYLPGIQPADIRPVQMAYDPGRFRVETDFGPVDLLGQLAAGQLTQRGLIQIGSAMGQLLPDTIRGLLAESLEIVRRRGQGLRLRLNIAAPELAALPWEYLYWKPGEIQADDTAHFLALQEDVSLVRHADIDFPLPRLAEPDSYRVVTTLMEQLERSRQALETGYQAAGLQEALHLDWFQETGVNELEAALAKTTDLFYFNGQVGMRDQQAGLVLANDERISAWDLARLLNTARVRLAVFGRLAGERGPSQPASHDLAGELIRRGLPAAVFGQYGLSEAGCRLLVQELARSVLAGDPVDAAMGNARRAIWRETGAPDWGSPALYLRVEDGVLFPRRQVSGEVGYQVMTQNVFNIVQNVGSVRDSAQLTAVSLRAETAGTAAPAVRRKPRLAPPRLVTPLIGRDDELAFARSRITQGGKFYFSGVFGVGKTSLASALFNTMIEERDYQDGYLWMRASGRDLESLLESIASKLDNRTVAEAVGLEAKLEALREALSQHPDLLLGLDDVNDTAIAQAILDAAGECPVVLNGTPRSELGGRAHSMSLEPLAPEEAESLFLSLANPTGSGLQPSDPALVGRICRKMHNLPLGVRLAALKYAEGESLETLWQRLQQAPISLIPGDAGMSSILNALLEDLQAKPAAWQMLLRLASFPGLEAPIARLREGIDDSHFFTAKDLLFYRGAVEPAGYQRLSLHPLLAAALLNAHSEAVRAEKEVTYAWLQEFAGQHRSDYDLLETEQANWTGLLDIYQAAEDWESLVRLMREVFNYLRVRGLWQEASRRLEAVLERPERLSDDWSRGWAYLHRGILELLHARDRQAAENFDQADRIFAALGDQAYRGKTLYRRSLITVRKGELAEAAIQLRQALEWMGEEAPASDRAGALVRLASLQVNRGDLDSAWSLYEQALALGETEEQARVHTALGDLARRKGDYGDATRHFDQALQLADRLGNLLQRAAIYQELGHVEYYQGALETAGPFYQKASDIYQELAYQPGLAQIEHALGNLAFSRKAYPAAAEHYQNALQRNEDLGHASRAIYNRYQLAVVLQRQNQAEAALAGYRQVLEGARAMDNVGLQAAALYQLGNLAYESGEKSEAIQYFTQALQLAEKVGERQIGARALFFTGLLQAQEGHYEQARDTLSQAQAVSGVLRNFEIKRIEAALAALEQGPAADLAGTSGAGMETLLPGDIIVPGNPAPDPSAEGLPRVKETLAAGETAGVEVQDLEPFNPDVIMTGDDLSFALEDSEDEDEDDDITVTGGLIAGGADYEEEE